MPNEIWIGDFDESDYNDLYVAVTRDLDVFVLDEVKERLANTNPECWADAATLLLFEIVRLGIVDKDS